MQNLDLIENLQDRGISQKEAAEQRAALASFSEDWNLPEMEIYDKLFGLNPA